LRERLAGADECSGGDERLEGGVQVHANLLEFSKRPDQG
jgi:hypothetical protein